MNSITKKTLSIVAVSATMFFHQSSALAGNKDRSGQAGANELLLNPWSRSTGMANANSSYAKGLEAQFQNVAGLSFTRKTEIMFSNTTILANSGIRYNSFGFSQKLGKSGVMGLSVNSLNFGSINITTVDNPEGGMGTFGVTFNNISLSYAKEFSNSIFGGINIKAISQSMPSLAAKGIAIDAGIQYLTGTNEEKNNIHFGIALKNVGPAMRYTGNGLTIKRTSPNSGQIMNVDQKSSLIELPALLNISGAYDFAFGELHRLTLAGAFNSNSYINNQYNVGVEYGFKNYFAVRGGYSYEPGGNSSATRNTFISGPSAGFTFETPFNKNGSTFGLDYSYRLTNPLNGLHSIGVRMNL